MDPLTHILLGASTGYALYHRKLGRTAAAVGGLAAFVPDADIFIRSSADPLLAVEYHRHFTHALPFAPLGAALVASLWWLRPRFKRSGRGNATRPTTTERGEGLVASATARRRNITIGLCALCAYGSHCLLDAATSYGTQLLWPFSRHRFGWDMVSVVDPAVTLTLAVGLAWASIRQRVRPAVIGLSLAIGYIAFGAVQHKRAAAAQENLAAARGHQRERFEVMPTLGNDVIWRALYLHDGKIYADRIRVGWFSTATVREGWSLPRVTERDLTSEETARNDRHAFQRFAWFSENWVARSPTDPTVLADMRYSLSAEAFDPIWGIRFLPVGAAMDVTWVNRSRDRRVSPRDLWAEIVGRDPRFRTLPD